MLKLCKMALLLTFIDHVRVWSYIGYDAISEWPVFKGDNCWLRFPTSHRETDRQRHKETHRETETHRQIDRQRWASDSNIRSEFPDQTRVLKPSTIPWPHAGCNSSYAQRTITSYYLPPQQPVSANVKSLSWWFVEISTTKAVATP